MTFITLTNTHNRQKIFINPYHIVEVWPENNLDDKHNAYVMTLASDPTDEGIRVVETPDQIMELISQTQRPDFEITKAVDPDWANMMYEADSNG